MMGESKTENWFHWFQTGVSLTVYTSIYRHAFY